MQRTRRAFLRAYPDGFRDPAYVESERNDYWETHQRWLEHLNQLEFCVLIAEGRAAEAAYRAARVEHRSRRPVLHAAERLALRESFRLGGASAFAEGLYEFLHGDRPIDKRFDAWVDVIAGLPRPRRRLLTWPVVTAFGFIAQPDRHLLLKPGITVAAADAYGFDLQLGGRPSWATYADLLDFADLIRADLADLLPRDYIDVQAFLWTLGSAGRALHPPRDDDHARVSTSGSRKS